MEIRAPNSFDWLDFFTLAKNEGWRISQVERHLLWSVWTNSASVLIDSGRFCGLVTAVAHANSGWIGNLLVPPALRGNGYGSRLFKTAMTSLLDRGVDTIWLTASDQGKPIYTREGFVEVDQIERWRLLPGRLPATGGGADGSHYRQLFDLDRAAWGECRKPFLYPLTEGNPVFACHESAALLQQEEALQIIGPWYSRDLCPGSNRNILQQILVSATPSVEIVADVLASTPLRSLLAAAMFEPVGKNALMAYGDMASIDLPAMVALGSLGSVG